MSVYDFERYRSAPREGSAQARTFRYPRSETEWRARYELLRASYHLESYTDAEAQAWHMFRAYDNSSPKKEIASPQRIHDDFAFVVNTDAAALFGGHISIEAEEGAPPEMLERAKAIWKRSKMDQSLPRLAHHLCLGRVYVEPQRLPRDGSRVAGGDLSYEAVLVVHEPEMYTTVVDNQTRTALTRTIIVDKYFDEADLTDEGLVDDSATLHVYRRDMDTEMLTVTLDGEVVAEETGPHGLGVVPGVNLVFGATQDTEHGVGCAPTLFNALALADSFITQVHATGARYADPKMYGKNVDLSDASIGLFGRFISWVQKTPGYDTEIGYLEPSMEGVRAVMDALKQLMDDVRSTYPEFALFRAGAGASGDALRMHAARFESKIKAPRAGALAGLATALEQAVAMETNQPYDPSAPGLVLRAGPILPPDVKMMVEMLAEAKRESMVTPETVAGHLQSFGIIPRDVNPAEYAAEALDWNARAAGLVFGSGRTMGQGEGEDEEDSDPAEDIRRMVADGDLTQEEADAIMAALEDLDG